MLFACSSPQTKEAYLESFEEFMKETGENYSDFDENDWKQNDEIYKHFTNEWYDKFSDELSISEELTIKGYQLEYNFYKAQLKSMDFFDEYLRDDYEELKEQIEYYIENDMDDDLKELKRRAKEAGDTAISIFNRIIEDIEEEEDEQLY